MAYLEEPQRFILHAASAAALLWSLSSGEPSWTQPHHVQCEGLVRRLCCSTIRPSEINFES